MHRRRNSRPAPRGIRGYLTGCSRCSLEVLIARLQSGGWIALQPEPHPTGSVAFDAHGRAVDVGVNHPLHAGELYLPHRLVCSAGQRPRPERRDIDG